MALSGSKQQLAKTPSLALYEDILIFFSQVTSILFYFSATKVIGFVNSVTLQVALPLCEKVKIDYNILKPAEQVLQLYQENLHSHNLFVLLKTMEIVVYQIK
jgi:hypothetical protein